MATNTLALARALAATDLANPPPGRAVFQDLFSLFMLHWPEGWTVWISLAVAAVWIAVGIAAARRAQVSVRPVLWGLLGFPAAVLAAAGSGLALGEAVQAVAGTATPWYAHPLPMRIAAGLLALAAVAAVAGAVVRRAGFWGLYLGVWSWWAALSVAVAVIMPGLSPLMLLPAGLAAAAAAVVTVSPWRGSRRAWAIAALIGLGGTSWAWLGFLRGSDYLALGPDLGPTVGVAVGLAGIALLPLVGGPEAYGRAWRPALAGAALLALLSAVVATQVPTYSAARPQRLNLLHVQERGSDRARWAIETRERSADPDRLGALGRVAGFTEVATPFPWSGQKLPMAPAPPASGRQVARLVSDQTVAGRRVATVELRPAADQNRVSLYVSAAAGLRRVVLPQSSWELDGLAVEEGFGQFHCVGADCDGLRVELQLDTGGPTTMFAAERSPGLPRGGEALLAARPATAVPTGGGDETITLARLELAGG